MASFTISTIDGKDHQVTFDGELSLLVSRLKSVGHIELPETFTAAGRTPRAATVAFLFGAVVSIRAN